MDNQILQKSELYKQLSKAQQDYIKFYENAMSSQGYNFSKQQGQQPLEWFFYLIF